MDRRDGIALRCPVCGRTFDGDPVYDFINAVPYPENVSRQATAYHTLRKRFIEGEGCAALGMTHERQEYAKDMVDTIKWFEEEDGVTRMEFPQGERFSLAQVEWFFDQYMSHKHA